MRARIAAAAGVVGGAGGAGGGGGAVSRRALRPAGRSRQGPARAGRRDRPGPSRRGCASRRRGRRREPRAAAGTPARPGNAPPPVGPFGGAVAPGAQRPRPPAPVRSFPARVQPAPFGAASGYVQFIAPNGTVRVPGGQGTSPTDRDERERQGDRRKRQRAAR